MAESGENLIFLPLFLQRSPLPFLCFMVNNSSGRVGEVKREKKSLREERALWDVVPIVVERRRRDSKFFSLVVVTAKEGLNCFSA